MITADKRNIDHKSYLEFKEKALNSGIVRKVMKISELTILNETTIEYKNIPFEITPEAFKALIRLCGLGTGAFEKITAALGDKISKQVVSMMQTAMATVSDKNTICMLVNQKNAKVVSFAKSAEGILSNAAYFKLFEDVMNNHAGMHIKNIAVTENGNIEISVLNEDWEFNVGGLNDEYFNSGLVFINTPDATIINPFNERLVCTNGMISTQAGMSLILRNTDAEHVNGFYDAVRNLKGVLNFETEFKNRVLRMIDTQASYAELHHIRQNVEYHVADYTNPDTRATVESFIPLMDVQRAFMAHLIDLHKVDHKQWKKIRTPLTVWELVNKLTDLSSHPKQYGLQLNGGNSSIFQLQKTAGELAFKPMYDTEDPVKQIF